MIVYILLLIGISKWARRWGREPSSWVVIGVFFSPIVAAVLLLMYGNAVDKETFIDKKIIEYKGYWRLQMDELIFVIKSRLPPIINEKAPPEREIDVDIDLSTEDQDPEPFDPDDPSL